MRHNVRTLLEILNMSAPPIELSDSAVLAKVEKWFEGFERELREFDIIRWLDKNHPKEEKWPDYHAYLITTLMKFITRELLGEDSE